MHRYGYSETPTHEPLASRRDFLLHIRQRLNEVTGKLYPGRTVMDIARLHNINKMAVFKATTKSTANPCGAEIMRVLMLNYLVHISGLRDTLIDIEREIWVLIQLTHDPRVASAGVPPMPAKRGPAPGQSRRARLALGDEFTEEPRHTIARRQKRSAEIRKAAREGRPMPKDAQPAIIMPFRVLAALDKAVTNEVPGFHDMTPRERENYEKACAALKTKFGERGRRA